jgi:FtsH-binding integral membrane protein
MTLLGGGAETRAVHGGGFPASVATPHDRTIEHRFFTGMAIAIALTVLAGFARSYYLRSYFETAPLPPILHLHGLVFSTWIALYVAQTSLVAANRVRVHRRLGVAGGVLAVVLVLVGTTTAIVRARQGASPPGGPPPLVFLVVPLTDMVVFAGLFAAAFLFRRQMAVHKRLMLLATVALLAAPVARLPIGVLQHGILVVFGLADLFIVALVTYDLAMLRRIHRATAWGGLALVASQPLRLMLGGTGLWLAFAGWLTR